MAKKKMTKKVIAKKNDLKYWVISDTNIKIGGKLLEADKELVIDQKTAELLKESIFFKKWSLKVYKI